MNVIQTKSRRKVIARVHVAREELSALEAAYYAASAVFEATPTKSNQAARMAASQAYHHGWDRLKTLMAAAD